MAHLILSNMSASFSELKKNPIGTVTAGGGLPIAILNRNQPAFYCVPTAAYEALLEKLDDRELNVIADQRLNDCQAFFGFRLMSYELDFHPVAWKEGNPWIRQFVKNSNKNWQSDWKIHITHRQNYRGKKHVTKLNYEQLVNDWFMKFVIMS